MYATRQEWSMSALAEGAQFIATVTLTLDLRAREAR